jgi:hypothetical protein
MMRTIDVAAVTELLDEWDTQISDDDSARIQFAAKERLLREIEFEARVKVRRTMAAEVRAALGL